MTPRAEGPEGLPPLPGVPRIFAAWLRFVARLLPSHRRGDWVREWGGEVAWGLRSGVLSRRDLWSRGRACVMDAWVVRRRSGGAGAWGGELRRAGRGLLRSPSFSVLAVLTLALGIGATTAIFSVVHGVLLKPLPYPEEDRLVWVGFRGPKLGYDEIPMATGIITELAGSSRTLASVTAYQFERFVLASEGGEPAEIPGAQVTPDFFRVLGVEPVLGRGFTDEEGVVGGPAVVVLGHALWQERFGGDPGVLGRAVDLDGVSRTVVGVMPPGFAFPAPETRLWRPYLVDPAAPTYGAFSHQGIARLAPGADPAAVHAELEAYVAALPDRHPDLFPVQILDATGLTPRVEPLRQRIVGEIDRPLWIVLGTVAVVLLMACANVANLYLVRTEARVREVAVRVALGADRGSLARFHLAESLLLAVVAGVGGVVLAALGVKLFMGVAPTGIPRVAEVGIDGTVMAFAAVVSLATGLAFGWVPLLRGGTAPADTLRGGSARGATGSRATLRTRNALVLSQVALALTLLVGSGLMFRSFVALRSTDPGFARQGLLLVPVTLPSARYPDAADRIAVWDPLLDRVRAIPGVTAVGGVDHFPLHEGKVAGPVFVEDQVQAGIETPPIVERFSVAEGSLAALGIPLEQGRDLTRDDRADGAQGMVVSRAAAEAWWPGEDPIGKRARWNVGEEWWTVVGVAGDVRFDALEQAAGPAVYTPLLEGDRAAPSAVNTLVLVLATERDPMALLGAVEEAVWTFDASLPIARPTTVSRVLAEAMARTSFTVVMLGIASAVALLLGVVGIYGVISYVVGQRTREIGVRMALGAGAAGVRAMVLRQGMSVVGVGLAVGLGISAALSRVFGGLLYGVEALDLPTYAATATGLAVVAALASWIPAWRASRVDPVEALRSDGG